MRIVPIEAETRHHASPAYGERADYRNLPPARRNVY